MRSEGYNAAYTRRVRLGRSAIAQVPVRKAVEACRGEKATHAEGVCIIDSLAFLKKSAEPPRPLSILEPSAFVELAWAYYSCQSSFVSILIIKPLEQETQREGEKEEGGRERLTISTSSGVFIAMIPNLLIISGELATC